MWQIFTGYSISSTNVPREDHITDIIRNWKGHAESIHRIKLIYWLTISVPYNSKPLLVRELTYNNGYNLHHMKAQYYYFLMFTIFQQSYIAISVKRAIKDKTLFMTKVSIWLVNPFLIWFYSFSIFLSKTVHYMYPYFKLKTVFLLHITFFSLFQNDLVYLVR